MAEAEAEAEAKLSRSGRGQGQSQNIGLEARRPGLDGRLDISGKRVHYISPKNHTKETTPF